MRCYFYVIAFLYLVKKILIAVLFFVLIFNCFKYLSILDSLYSIETAPKKKVEDLIHLAELCIDLLQQNEEHHSEVRRKN